jgi:hypothetical protein
MTKRTRKVLLILLAIYCVPVFIVGLFVFPSLRPLPPLVPLPHPNAYEDLVKAGGMVATNTGLYAKMKAEQLRPLVEQNADALILARDALDSPCRVPVVFSQIGQQTNVTGYVRLRHLAEAFAAESRLAQLDRQPNKAAGCDLDCVRLGVDAARGGILIDAMIGNAIESLGTTDLPKLVNQLDAPTCREAAVTLERLGAEKASWADVVKQEDVWIRRTFGWKAILVEIIFHHQMNRNLLRAQKSYQAAQYRTRQLMIDLASRAYKLEKGHRPASNADLVPEYLMSVPKSSAAGNK